MEKVESVKDHYDSFLGEVYSWILGDFEVAYRKNVELFAELNLVREAGELALDLGCGPGCQSLPLAELGYDVLAVDFCQDLLDELSSRADQKRIKTVCDDILNFPDHLTEQPNLIVCMGDTLVHLPNRKSVASLVDKICVALKPAGLFIYAIRDYISYVPTGADRFIPIRADDNRIFTCFLEYRDDVVHVHDILHRRQDDNWHTSISDYLKLRLDTSDINHQLEINGMTIRRRFVVEGMITVVAEKS